MKECRWPFSQPTFKYYIVHNAARRYHKETMVNFEQKDITKTCRLHKCVIYVFIPIVKPEFVCLSAVKLIQGIL
jgi:hypothetical protein